MKNKNNIKSTTDNKRQFDLLVICDQDLIKKLEAELVKASLDITSFTYCGSMGAEHYYGKIIFWGSQNKIIEQVNLQRKIDMKEAKYLDEKDNACGTFLRGYKLGNKHTNRFNSEYDVLRVAYDFCGELSRQIDLGFGLTVSI